MDYGQFAGKLYEEGFRGRDFELVKMLYKLTEAETNRIHEELDTLEKAHNTFGNLKPFMQWTLVREFCSDQALDDLYPEDSLGDLLDVWGVNTEYAFYLGSKNGFLIRFTDNVFIGDANNGIITSFRNWGEYMRTKFIPEVWEEFQDWMDKNHPEMGVKC